MFTGDSRSAETVVRMARHFRPERVEYDVITGSSDSANPEDRWTTAAVDAVTPNPLAGFEALHTYASALVPRLRDFAEHMAAPRSDERSAAQRFAAYQSVRAMVRGSAGEALAEIHRDGRILLPA